MMRVAINNLLIFIIFVQFIHFFLPLKNNTITKFKDNFVRAYKI